MITVFGSINVDLILKTERLPGPGETVLCPSYVTVPGGKGANQALAAAKAGSSVRLVGCVGNDDFKHVALHDLQKAGVDLSAVRTTASRTACAAVMVDALGENAIVVASGANRDASAAFIPIEAFALDSLLMLQMEVPLEENWCAIEQAKAAGLKVMLNLAPAAPIPPEILGLIDYLLVNELEGRTIASISELRHLPSDQLPQNLAQRYGLTCVLTLGGAGAIAADPDSVWRVPALKIAQIVDTTGAGDAFAGCFAAALTRGEETRAALKFAAVGAGLSCTTLGTQPSFPTAGAINSIRLQK